MTRFNVDIYDVLKMYDIYAGTESEVSIPLGVLTLSPSLYYIRYKNNKIYVVERFTAGGFEFLWYAIEDFKEFCERYLIFDEEIE